MNPHIKPRNAVEELVDALQDLVEICRVKCSPNDEVISQSGKTNHQALILACRALELGLEARKPRGRDRKGGGGTD